MCSLGVCISGCQLDQDCADVPGRPICSAGGTCVGCEDASQCPAEAAICDAATHACRGCTGDGDCTGGVCLEVDGVCAADDNVVFVAAGGSDAGTCSRMSPCGTLGFGFSKVTATRSAIRLLTSAVDVGTPMFGKSAYVGGLAGGTTLIGPASPAIDIAGQITVTLANIKLGGPTLSIRNGATARLDNFEAPGLIDVNTGTLTARLARTRRIACTSGTLSIRDSQLTNPNAVAAVEATTCDLTIQRNRFEGTKLLYVSGGKALVENNLFIGTEPLADITQLLGTLNSSVRFNTFVNTTTSPSDGAALCFDPSVSVTSNVFAYNSVHPLGSQSCTGRAVFSLFDGATSAVDRSGFGNQQADRATFFVDLTNLDLHLGTTSPARAASEPGLGVTTDFAGAVRPQPAGTVADAGAFEAP
ncbi:MAG: hypothetical protein KF773_26580 [Deltaproteobacteria bacterium]|nr:hypothetical protein [Deltaproteobacteria bacterium]